MRLPKFIQNLLNLYRGAQWSPARTYLHGTYQDSHLDLTKATRAQLAAKVRELETDNGIIQRSADLSEQFVAGANGMPVMAASSDEEWNARAQEWWDKWCNFPDIASQQSFGTLQGLMVRTVEIDGECFIRKTFGSTGNPRLQLIEGHRISSPPDQDKREGKMPGVIDGVEVDAVGRPIGYWMEIGSGPEREYRLLDASTIIHYFEPSRIGQKRGLTPWHAAINDLIDLDDLQALEMGSAKDNARISQVLKSESGEMSVADLRRQLVSSGSQNSSGTTITQDRTKYVRDITGVTTIGIKTTEALEQFRSDRPSVAVQDYWDFLIGKACAARGISKILAFPQGKPQGTLVRAELDIMAGFYRSRSAVLQTVLEHIWVFVMGNAIRLDRTLRNEPKDWTKVWIIPPRSPNVDVGYNSAATLAEWEAGAKPLRDICAPLGLNWKSVIDQLAIEAAYKRRAAKKAGIDPSEIGERGSLAPAPEPQPQEAIPA